MCAVRNYALSSVLPDEEADMLEVHLHYALGLIADK